MSLSLTPSRRFSLFPGFPRREDIERDIERGMDQMQRMFNEAVQGNFPDEGGVHRRQPNYTYEEDNQQAEIQVELPGVAKGNVNIDLQNDTLTVYGKRYSSVNLQPSHHIPIGDQPQQSDQPEKQDTETTTAAEPKLSVEYKLDIPIGNKFDADGIAATMLGDGILSVTVPKKVEQTGPSRMIEISAA